ncbi:Copper metallochaperone, bacterial similar to Cox17 protein [Rubellimicrobium mesophilum DSM 19309]|uniref:Copper metallochaperone, bacterial similar to Cox17 protein n=1 Tax=Rubellimicrobium mesophilum DSM 19309 TaxID=442562 RepID=A0A017HD92_9RHOB|nr:copper chaperone PCu(A)C [Rubellimicrobium mesophilum]EYD72088.1 Copper metallochaperone, bacterial similar to Cox17 protein [Rubellimicrobium mesophilum DSM 19309]
MLRAALAALLLAAPPALADEGHIEIHGAYAISPTPQSTTGAAYMMIHNHASEPDHLLSVASPAAGKVQVHDSSEVDGVMRMEPLAEPLEIPAGSVAMLQRGGTHLMFMGLADPWEDGESIPVTLTFEHAGEVTVDVPVDLSRLADAPADGMEDMDHGSMEGMDMGGEGD